MIHHSRPHIGSNDIQAVSSVLGKGMLAEGDLALRFAQRITDVFGGHGSVACGSGTQAVVMALSAAQIGPGSRVALPTYVCPNVLAGIKYVGAEPVFCDIDDDLLLSGEQALHAAQTCDALIIPYIFGRWRDYSHTRNHKAVIIEDFAQFIAPRSEKFPGLQGDFGILSMHATKMICSGEGGAVLAASSESFERIMALKQIGNSEYPFNLFPLSDLQAALALSQLEQLEEFTKLRAAIAQRYSEVIEGLPELSLPPAELNIHFRFPIMLLSGTPIDEVIADFSDHSIAVRKPVDTLAHWLVPEFENEMFSASQQAWNQCFSIPLYPELTEEEQELVVYTLLQFFNQA